MDIVFTQQATSRVGPIKKPQTAELLRPALMDSTIMEELKKSTNYHSMVPNLTRRTPKLGLVEIRQDFVYPGKDVYIVAQ